MKDEEIVLELKKGNTTVLKYCYQKTLGQVENMVLKNGGSAEDAKDLFHDSLIVLNNNCKKSDFKLTASIGTYLYSICKYSWMNQKSKERRGEEALKKINDDTNDLAYKTTNELIEVMIKAMEKLGGKCKEILMDYYFGKFSYDEIAQSLEYSNGQVVRQQKYRCIQKLKEITDATING